jgi:quinol monooxygenase YgiN
MPRKAKKEIVCVAQFTAKPGKVNQLISSLHKLMKPTHKEKGCVRYELNQQIDNPRVITFIEKWADKKTFDKHCAMPYITDYFNNLAPKLVKAQSVTLHREILP